MALQTINLGRVKGDAFTYEDFTPEQLDDLRGKDGKDFPRFTGTAAEYEAVEFDIEEGTIVTITDDFDEENLIGADTLKRVADLEDAVANFEGVDNAVYLTQEQYDALPESKLTDDVEYRITDAGIENVSASNVEYDNAVSGLGAVNVQGAVDELKEDVSTLSDGLSNVCNTTYNFVKSFVSCNGGSISVPNTWKDLEIQVLINNNARMITLPLKRGAITSNWTYHLRGGYYQNTSNYMYLNFQVVVNADMSLTITPDAVEFGGTDEKASSRFAVVYTNNLPK